MTKRLKRANVEEIAAKLHPMGNVDDVRNVVEKLKRGEPVGKGRTLRHQLEQRVLELIEELD